MTEERSEAHIDSVARQNLLLEQREANAHMVRLTIRAQELTEQAEAARAREEMLVDELRLANQRKDEFLAMLAHELRNPMAAISMALTMMELASGNADKSIKLNQTAQRQMGHLVRLVDDLLDVSRITQGKVELRTEKVDLALVIESAVTATRPAVEARGHVLSVTVDASPFRMKADATRIEQVIVNLLTNAAKYTESAGTITLRLVREVIDGKTCAVVRVKDTGRGIPKDMLENVFDLFLQLSPGIDRATGGLGLGLSLVKRLVEMHGGTVFALSDGPGRGSEFVVRLPLEDEPHVVVGPTRVPEAFDSSKQRILVVEDAADVRDTLRDFLQLLGHDVETARNGVEGAALILQIRPDVSLVDVGLPGIDGYEVARRVRASPRGKKLYLAALSGYGGPDAIAKAHAAGFDLHITKPLDVDDLSHVLNCAKNAVH